MMVYHMEDNYTADAEDEWDDESKNHLFISGSLAAHGEEGEPEILQCWLNDIIAFILLWLVYPILAIRHKRLVNYIDEGSITPSDFTLEFSNLPTNFDSDDFKTWLEGISVQGRNVKVAKVCLAYDIDEYVTLRRKYLYWR
jgi:hypothetical protein